MVQIETLKSLLREKLTTSVEAILPYTLEYTPHLYLRDLEDSQRTLQCLIYLEKLTQEDIDAVVSVERKLPNGIGIREAVEQIVLSKKPELLRC